MKSTSLLKGLTIVFVVTLFAAFALPAVFASTPTGSSPNDPLMVTGASQTIAPNTSLWFYFDYTTDRSRPKAMAALDANGAQNIKLAIYTPDQAMAWLRDSTDPAAAPVAEARDG